MGEASDQTWVSLPSEIKVQLPNSSHWVRVEAFSVADAPVRRVSGVPSGPGHRSNFGDFEGSPGAVEGAKGASASTSLPQSQKKESSQKLIPVGETGKSHVSFGDGLKQVEAARKE